MKSFAITGRVLYDGPDRFTASALAVAAADAAPFPCAEAIHDTSESSDTARIKVFELVAVLVSRIRARGDSVQCVEIE